MDVLLVLVVIIALVFDFTNGFHDTANSIATLVGTRAMAPQAAVLMAAMLNFVGAFLSLEVAATVAKGVVDLPQSEAALEVVLAGVVGAIVWNLVTWYFGLPSSSSHALIGGMVGATVMWGGPSAVHWSGVFEKVLLPSIVAPLLGVLGGLGLMYVLMRAFRNVDPRTGNKFFRRAQILTGGWLSLTHGMNDATKTMGIIALALSTSGHLDTGGEFTVPTWVIFSAASAMGLGTYAGGWKIIKTLGGKVVKMNPMQGFSASVAAAAILQTAGTYGLPVSTTQCVSGCVLGSGASKRLSAVRWTVAGDIASAWVLTLPAAAAVGALAYLLAAISPALLLAVGGGTLFALRVRIGQANVAH